MQRIWTGGLMVVLLLLVRVTTAAAVPVVSVDLDGGPGGTAGIQSTLSVTTGTSFTIDVTYTGDGVVVFDAFVFDAVFNDLGAVLGLAGGTGMPTAGSVAGTAPFSAFDAFTAGPVVPGSPLTPSGVPFPIPAPFTAQSDGLGILSVVLPFGGGVPIGSGVTIDLFSLTLDALTPGMSTMLPSAGVIPPPLGGLAVAGAPVPATLSGGTVTVTGTTLPVPGTLPLLGIGLIGLAASGWWQRKQAAETP